MTDTISPEDIKKQLDDYIGHQKAILDNEISKIIKTSDDTVKKGIEKSIHKIQRQIEHPKTPPSLFSKMITAITPKGKSKK